MNPETEQQRIRRMLKNAIHKLKHSDELNEAQKRLLGGLEFLNTYKDHELKVKILQYKNNLEWKKARYEYDVIKPIQESVETVNLILNQQVENGI